MVYQRPPSRLPCSQCEHCGRGATTGSRPGNLRRLITVVQQLDLNYDLYGIRADEIVQLLPSEFDAWKPGRPVGKGASADVAAGVDV